MMLDEDDFYTNTWFVFNVLSGLCCTFGIIGHLISSVVLYRMKEQKSTVYLLFTLSIVDVLFLVYILTSKLLCLVAGYPEYHDAIFRGFWIIWPLGGMAHTAGTWLIVAITCDRYLVVHFPLKKICWNMPKKLKWVIVGILIASVLFNIPRFFGGIGAIVNIKNFNGTGADKEFLLHDINVAPEIKDGNSSFAEAMEPVPYYLMKRDLKTIAEPELYVSIQTSEIDSSTPPYEGEARNLTKPNHESSSPLKKREYGKENDTVKDSKDISQVNKTGIFPIGNKIQAILENSKKNT